VIELLEMSNFPQIDMLSHSDTLSWFPVNQSLLFLLEATCYKTDRHDITEILLKVALNTINQTNLNGNSWKIAELVLNNNHSWQHNFTVIKYPFNWKQRKYIDMIITQILVQLLTVAD
jgi:uncharacterized membrane-anchored protein YjiN (DUF445 family)